MLTNPGEKCISMPKSHQNATSARRFLRGTHEWKKTAAIRSVSNYSTRSNTLMIHEQEIQEEWFLLPPNMKLPNERNFSELLSM